MLSMDEPSAASNSVCLVLHEQCGHPQPAGRGAGDDRLSKMSKLRERQSKVVQAGPGRPFLAAPRCSLQLECGRL